MTIDVAVTSSYLFLRNEKLSVTSETAYVLLRDKKLSVTSVTAYLALLETTAPSARSRRTTINT